MSGTNTSGGAAKKRYSNQEIAKPFQTQVIRKLETRKVNHLLKTIFGVLIWLICN